MQELDHAIKTVAQRHPECFLDLFFGRERAVKLQSVEDAQIQTPEHRADKVWRIHDGVQEGCLLLEAIAQPDRRDFGKFLLKNAAFREALGVPVITALVYLQRGKYVTFPDGFEEDLGGLKNGFRFTRVLLWEHAGRIRSGELKELAPFLPLFEAEPDPKILEEVNEIVETVADPKERLELKSLGAIIAARIFAEELIKQALRLEFPMVRETTIFSEWLTQEHNKGWAEGKIKGEIEGEIKGKHVILQKLLEKRFGELATDVKISLQKLSGEQLDALTLAILDLQSLDDFKAWLRACQPESAALSQPQAAA